MIPLALIRAALPVVLAACTITAAQAAEPVTRLTVGFQAGGGLDSVARALANALNQEGSHKVIVENRPGASGIIAIDAVRNARSDDSMLVILPSGSITMTPHTNRHFKYDPERDLTPIARIATYTLGLAVSPETKADTLGGFLALFKNIGAGESSYNRFDRAVAGEAARWLRERGQEQDASPWVLFVGLVAPHFPLIVPPEYLERFPAEDMPLPRLHPKHGYQRHPWVERHARFSRHDEQLGTDDRRRLALASYFALTSFMDEQVGHVLEALSESGLDENTTVIYSSDHGDNLGERGLWNKCTLYRESTAVPMIVRGPGVPAGQEVRSNVSLVDLFPTILHATGVELSKADSDLPGQSLIDNATQPYNPGRLVFAEYHAVGSESAGYMLADSRYTYHYYVGHAPELFDLEADPDEANDLAGDPAYAEVLEQFRVCLNELLDPEDVDRQAKADQQRLIESFGGREAALSTGTPGATPVPSA